MKMKTRYFALAIHLSLLAPHALASQPADRARLGKKHYFISPGLKPDIPYWLLKIE